MTMNTNDTIWQGFEEYPLLTVGKEGELECVSQKSYVLPTVRPLYKEVAIYQRDLLLNNDSIRDATIYKEAAYLLGENECLLQYDDYGKQGIVSILDHTRGFLKIWAVFLHLDLAFTAYRFSNEKGIIRIEPCLFVKLDHCYEMHQFIYCRSSKAWLDIRYRDAHHEFLLIQDKEAKSF